jgi:hypothetical protein
MPAASPTVERNHQVATTDVDGTLPPSVEAGAAGVVARVPTVDGVLVLRKLSPQQASEAEAGRHWRDKVDLRPYMSVLREASGGEWVWLDPKEAGISALALRKRIHLAGKLLKLNLHWAGTRKGESRVWLKLV